MGHVGALRQQRWSRINWTQDGRLVDFQGIKSQYIKCKHWIGLTLLVLTLKRSLFEDIHILRIVLNYNYEGILINRNYIFICIVWILPVDFRSRALPKNSNESNTVTPEGNHIEIIIWETETGKRGCKMKVCLLKIPTVHMWAIAFLLTCISFWC